MTKENQTTDASKTELTDDELENAAGAGPYFIKFDGVDGESKDTVPTEEFSLNFAKVEVDYRELESTTDKTSLKLKR